jgi:hypothetical protein
VKGPFNRQFRLASWGSLLHRSPTYLLRKTPDFAGALGGESDDAPDSCPANFSQHTGLSHVQARSRPRVVRSMIFARSNSAKAPSMVSVNFQGSARNPCR